MKCLCDLDKKEVEKRIEKIKRMVDKPKYICRKCARAANDADYVCKPVTIEPAKP